MRRGAAVRPFILALLTCTACGSGPLPPPVWVNDSPRPTSNAQDVWATTESVLGEVIDLSGYTVHLTAHYGDDCPPHDIACTYPDAHAMVVPYPLDSELNQALTAAQHQRGLAAITCHELMHVHCHETMGDDYCGVGETDHKYKPPFDYTTDPTSTCYKIADLFAGGFEP